MNPSVAISVVVAIASLHTAEALFGADIVTGSGALFTGGGGTHLVLASGAGIGGAAAVVGGAILLKSLVLLSASRAGRGKRSVGEETNPNSEALFPILSTAALAEDPKHESDIVYSKGGGQVVEIKNRQISKFIRHGSVYFMKMFLRKRDLHKPSKMDFARPGTGA